MSRKIREVQVESTKKQLLEEILVWEHWACLLLV